MRFTTLLAAFVLLAVMAIAGNQLPASNTWTGTSDTGKVATTVTSSASGFVIVVDRTYTSPEGVVTRSSMTCALNSAGSAYATPDGGEIEFDDVVDGNQKAYRYELRSASGGVREAGLVSQ